jgi:Cof subfamily protein (haloacid dehalogenase superfamily)
MIRLLVSDIDGTLVRDDKTLSDANRNAILSLERDGVAITLISARPPSGMRELAESLQLRGPFVAFNGGTLFNLDGTIRFAYRLDAADAAATLRLIDAPGVTTWVFADGTWFTTSLDTPHLARERRAAALEPIIRTDFTDLGDRIDKIVGVADDSPLLDQLEEHVKAAVGARATVVRSQPYYLDITHRRANKGDGILALAAACGVDLKQVAAVGDMTNDIAMFAHAGLSIAMGQAPEDVQAAADAVAATNEQDGVADAIMRFIRPRTVTP